MTRALCLSALSFASVAQAATIQGWIFRDANGNGLRDADLTDTAQDTYERGLDGLTVAAINASGVLVAGTFTFCTARGAPNVGCVSSLDRFYTISVPDNSAQRVEISELSTLANGVLRTGIQSSATPPAGQAGSNSAVQFVNVTTGTTSNINFAVQYADQFCPANPDIAIPKYIWRGTDATENPTTRAFLSFGYQSGTISQTATTNQGVNSATSPIVVDAEDIGATWGVAYDRTNNTLFAAALTRRHVPFFNNGVGVGRIYRIGTSGVQVPSVYVDFESTSFLSSFPDAVSTDFDATAAVDRDPHDNTPNYETDTQAWDNVGKSAFGDIDVGPDNNLYAIALRDRRMYRIPVLASGTPTNTQVSAFTIPQPTPACTNGQARPFALGFNDGRGYVGVTCTAEDAGGLATDLRAVIFEFNPALATPTFTQVVDFPLNYGRGCASQNSGGQQTCTTAPAEWRPWTTDTGCGVGSAPFTAQQICPQPMVADINFDEYGYATLGIADRLGLQTGNASAGYSAGTTEGVSAGDTIRFSRTDAGVWTVEANGVVTGTTLDAGANVTTQLNQGGTGAGTAPAGIEFYWHDDFNDVNNGTHSDVTLGGGVIVPGTGEYVTAAFDPSPEGPVRSGGTAYFSNWRVDGIYNYGERTRSFLEFGGDANGTFGKAAGMGDLEAICGQAPLQLGNRVWADINGDGVQDAGEPGFANVPITLTNAAGTIIGQTTTDANGNWYFNFETLYSGSDATLTDATVQLTSANLYGQQVFVMVGNTNATGFGTAGSINGASRTTNGTNSGATGVGTVERDSDGVIIDPPGAAVGNSVGVSVTLPSAVGESVHAVDFGFIPPDRGDLPDTGASTGAGNYQTLSSDNGPSNLLSVNLRLGAAVGSLSTGYDNEAEAQQTVNADGDNTIGDNDENGVTFPAIRLGVAPTIALSVFNNTGATQNVCGYIDFNNNGSFADAGEAVTATVTTGASLQAVNLAFTGTLPAVAPANNNLYSRFRVQTEACSPFGFGGSGEIEDYAIPVSNVAIASSAAGSYCPGQSVSYTITITNPAAAATATNFPFTADLIGTNEAGLAGAPLFAVADWAVTSITGGASAAATSGSGDISTTVSVPAAGSLIITVQGTFSTTTTSTQTASADVLASAGSADRNASDAVNNNITQTSAATCNGTPPAGAAICPNLGSTGTGALNPGALACDTAGERVLNSYYPSVASVAAGARCVQVGAIRTGGSTAPIATGNVLLIAQMQGATINSTNTNIYGDGGPTGGAPGGATAAIAGAYEYVIAQSGIQPNGAGICTGQTNVVQISGGGTNSSANNGFVNAYTHATGVNQQSTYQVIRVPVHTNVTFTNATCAIGAATWNGSTGGIAALEATQTINLSGGAGFNASGAGFRGGICSDSGTDEPSASLFAATTGVSSSGKAEGYAGSPAAAPISGGGFTGGDFARGAPGSGGGGGHRCLGTETSGGGGGGGRAAGGSGGNDGCGLGAHGGGPLPSNNNATRLLLGGGGGAGASQDPCPLNSLSGNGGGVVLIRARQVLGTGTINVAGSASGGVAANNIARDGGGGGGTIVLLTSVSGTNNYSNITFNAEGGDTPTGTAANATGGGGGGGGVFRSQLVSGANNGIELLTGGTAGGGSAVNGNAGIEINTLDPATTVPGVKPAYICAQSSTVPVTLSKVAVTNEGSELVVRFNTASEAGTLGYRILADVGAESTFSRVELGFIESKKIDSLTEQSYTLRSRAIGASNVWIEESSVDGKAALYGPYAIGASIGESNLAPAMNWAAVNAEQVSFRTSQQVNLRSIASGAAQVSVSQDQWLSFSASELAAAGLVGDVAVNQGTRVVPAQVLRDANGAVARVGFYAKAANSLYTKTAIYRLSAGTSALMPVQAAQVQSGMGAVLSDLSIDQNKLYSFTAPNDPWFNFRAIRNIAGTSNGGSTSFTLGDYAGGGAERIQLNYWGGSSYSGEGADHSVQFLLNGQVVGSDRFDGFAARTLDVAIPAGALRAGANTLSLQMVNDTGFASDIVNVESYTLRYRRNLRAENNRLEATIQAIESGDGFASGFEDAAVNPSNGPSSYVITNLTAPSVVLRERAGVQTLLATSSGSEVAVQFDAQVGDRLIVSPATSSAALNSAAAASDPIGSSSASYLIISHPSFIGGLSQFVTAKQAQGFTVKVVDVEALYRYYNAGVVDPAAISLAIRNAQRTGTTHVLLVGGDTYDYHNVLGINSVSFVPTNYRRTDAIVNFAPADSVYADTDGNGAPNVALGRWPVRTQAELQAVIAKTLSYQNRKVAVMVNDRALNGERYSQADAPFAALLPQDWSKQLVDLDGFTDTAIARAEIVSKLTQGASLLSYYGHSAPASWSREGLITATQLSNGLMSGVNQSFVTVQLGCWGTYFVEPTSTTVAHQLLLMPKGAAAVLGASTLTLTNSDKAFAERLLPSIGTGTLGESLKAALQSLSADPSAGDVSVGGTLLGDPALR